MDVDPKLRPLQLVCSTRPAMLAPWSLSLCCGAADHYCSCPATMLVFLHNGNAGAVSFQLNQQFACLRADRRAARCPELPRWTPEVGKSRHHVMLHSVVAQSRGLAFEIGRDDEHARQVSVGTSLRSML